jgi:PAS domain S-box-containing protein
MMIAVWRRWIRWVTPSRLAVALVLLALSLSGFFYVSRAVNEERRSAASDQAVVDAQAVQQLLERAGTFETGVADALAGESRPNALRFAAIVDSATAPVGLTDVMWVQSVSAGARSAYQQHFGVILWPPGSEVAPLEPRYFPATYVVGLPYLIGTDVAALPPLAATLDNPTSVFAGTATSASSVDGQPGFFLVQGAQFGRGPGSQGFLVVFVPGGWLGQALTGSSGRAVVRLDGRDIAGAARGRLAGSQRFEALTQQWQVGVAEAPASALQAQLPWYALAWPAAVALIVLLVGRGVLRRRRAEREIDDIFDLSVDLLCTIGEDGCVRRMNPAFERTLGYDAGEVLTRPLADFVHPDDRASAAASLASVRQQHTAASFEGRFVRADGTVRWLQWNARAPVEQGLIYAAARDVTEARLLAREQAALRRVATLVAEGAQAGEVFDSVALEVRQLLGADSTRLLRQQPDGATAVLAASGGAGGDPAPGASRDGSTASSSEVEAAGEVEVAAPVVVSARSWGTIVATWRRSEDVPPGVDARLAQFTELVATAVANTESRALLAASRRRIVATADETRRRIERDLHDGAQQRLVSTALTLKLAELAVAEQSTNATQLVRDALASTEQAVEELRELARGIHPAVLTRSGLEAALKALARRSPVAVALDVRLEDRLPAETEATIYFVVSEALTNAAKHAAASEVTVTLSATRTGVELSIDDDGVGGADPAGGSGLTGLRDRIEAVGGTLAISSPAGEGTHLSIELPAPTVAAG